MSNPSIASGYEIIVPTPRIPTVSISIFVTGENVKKHISQPQIRKVKKLNVPIIAKQRNSTPRIFDIFIAKRFYWFPEETGSSLETNKNKQFKRTMYSYIIAYLLK